MAESDDTPQDKDGLFKKLKDWFTLDYEAQSEWRRLAKEDFAYASGDQWSDADKQALTAANRPIVVMNRIDPVIDSVAGAEVSNRQAVQYLPRSEGDVKVNEILTSAAQWFRDQCDAEDEESDAFRDTIICGMGWTETRLDYEDEPDGAPKIERRDPLEMVWDSSASKRNLSDMRRVAHIRRDIPIEEARALIKGGADLEDEDFNATWVEGRKGADDPHHVNDTSYDKDEEGGEGGGEGDKTVTMVRMQWYERETYYRVLDPFDASGQSIKAMTAAEFKLFRKRFEELQAAGQIPPDLPLDYVESTRKVFKQAFLGRILLDVSSMDPKPKPGEPSPMRCTSFSFKAITGKRARNKKQFYGLVRSMKDPQQWANKWLSQTMHIMNTTAKGGIAVERGKFFEDDVTGPESWARNDQTSWLKPGALSGDAKMLPKPYGQLPQSTMELMQFAIASIRDVSGVNVELLGLANNAGQAAELDRQRKQSALTILQPLFDSLRRYRKEQGRHLLFLIQNYLSDGRLIKIVGEEGAQYVPLVRQPGVDTFDVIVDEAPTSPNQKEATWAMLQQILPVIGKMLPPQTWLALMKYSPLPTSAQEEIRKSMDAAQQSAQQQPDPAQQKTEAEINAMNAKTQASIANDQAKTQSDIKIKQMSAAADASLKAQQAQGQQAIAAQQAANPPQPEVPAELMQTIASLQQSVQMLTAAITGGMAPQGNA